LELDDEDDELALDELGEEDELDRDELVDPSEGEVGESSQPTSAPTPARTAPPLRIRRNSRRFSSEEASSS